MWEYYMRKKTNKQNYVEINHFVQFGTPNIFRVQKCKSV